MNDPVRVKLENGLEVTVQRDYADRKKLKVLSGVGAVAVDGRPLADSGQVDDIAVARADAKLAAETAAERADGRRVAKKATKKTAKKTAAKKTAAPNPGADSTPPSDNAGAGEGNQS